MRWRYGYMFILPVTEARTAIVKSLKAEIGPPPARLDVSTKSAGLPWNPALNVELYWVTGFSSTYLYVLQVETNEKYLPAEKAASCAAGSCVCKDLVHL